MLNRFKRIRRLSKYDDPVLERMDALAAAIEENQRLSTNGLAFTPDDVARELNLGEDGGLVRGEFLPDMTDSEVLEYERTERLGWKKFKLPWQK